MKFACEECGKKYVLSDDKISSKDDVRLKCRQCGEVIIVKKDGEVLVEALTSSAGRVSIADGSVPPPAMPPTLKRPSVSPPGTPSTVSAPAPAPASTADAEPDSPLASGPQPSRPPLNAPRRPSRPRPPRSVAPKPSQPETTDSEASSKKPGDSADEGTADEGAGTKFESVTREGPSEPLQAETSSDGVPAPAKTTDAPADAAPSPAQALPMEAGLGATAASPNALEPPATELFSMNVSPAPAQEAPAGRTIDRIWLGATSPEEKRRLLIALGAGFILGMLFGLLL